MKFFVSLFLIVLLAFVSGLFLPWWTIAVVSFIVSVLIPQKPRRAFLTGFLALGLLWAVLSLWIDTRNEHILSHKLATVLPFSGSSLIMILFTALVGALVAGFASLTGSYMRMVKE